MEWVMLQEFDCVVARGGLGWGGGGGGGGEGAFQIAT